MQSGKVTINLFGIKWLKWSVKFTCPESFDECTTSQLSWWAENVWSKLDYYFEKPLKDSPLAVKDENRYVIWQLKIVQQFTGISSWLFSNLDFESQRNIIFNWKLCSFALSEQYEPEYNPITQIGKLFGPTSADVFVPWEFSFIDINYLRYKESRNTKHLYRFLAHMYRNAKQSYTPEIDSDIREKFTEHSYTLRLDEVSKMPKGHQLLILYWYETWRLSLPKIYKHLFSTKTDKNVKSSGSWLPVFQSASNGIHNFDKIQYMNCMLLFSEIDRLILQNKELEKKYARK